MQVWQHLKAYIGLPGGWMNRTVRDISAGVRAQNDFNIDCSLAKRDLSWQGEASYKEAIFRAVEWILKCG